MTPHTPAEPYCAICGKSFYSQRALTLHVQRSRNHGTTPVEPDSAVGEPESAHWYVNNQEEYDVALKEATKAGGGRIHLAPGRYGAPQPLDPGIRLIGVAPAEPSDINVTKAKPQVTKALHKPASAGDELHQLLVHGIHRTEHGFDITEAHAAITRYIEGIIGEDMEYHKLEFCPICKHRQYQCSCADAINQRLAEQRRRLQEDNHE